MMKYCKHCQDQFPVDGGHFYNDGSCKITKRARSKAWAAVNRQKARANSRAWRVANPEKTKASKKAWAQKNWAKTMVSDSRKSDIKAGRYDPVNYITPASCEAQMAKQNRMCCYCPNGKPMVYGLGIDRRSNPLAATIERINNGPGHNIPNCLFCHKKCQRVNHPLNRN